MASNLGLPKINITFSSQAASVISRSARGVGAMVLNDSNVTDSDGVKYKLIEDSTDIPSSGIDDGNVDLIQKALIGTPSRVHVYFIPPATHEEEQVRYVESEVDSDVVVTHTVDSDVVITRDIDSDVVVTNPDTGATDTQTISVTITDTQVQQVTYTDTQTIQVTVTNPVTETVIVPAQVTLSDALQKAANVRFNYICYPTGTAQNQQDLASWTKNQRNNRDRTVKAVVANYNADDYGIINFTTNNIKLNNPAYTEALALVDGDESAVDSSIPPYLTYTATQYTARIMGILAGLPLDRSATYYSLPEIVSVDEYDDIESHIDNGELCLFDEMDGNGVKIARGCNSLHTFTANVGQDFRFIKTVEGVDIIKDDIRDNFRNNYVGKVPNNYNNKMLFIAAILAYFNGLAGTVLDVTSSGNNYVEIDYEKNRDYAKMRGEDVADMTEQSILEYNTGTQVFLRGKITLLNAMEDLTLHFSLD